MSEQTGTWGSSPGAPPPDVGWGGGAATDTAWGQPAPPDDAAWGLPPAGGDGASVDAAWGGAPATEQAWTVPAATDAGWGAATPAAEVTDDRMHVRPGMAGSVDAAWGAPAADAGWGAPAAAPADAGWGAPEPAADAAWGLPPAEEPVGDAAWGLPASPEPAADTSWGLPPAAEPAADAAWGLPAAAETAGDGGWGLPPGDPPAEAAWAQPAANPGDEGGWGLPPGDEPAAAFDPVAAFEDGAATPDAAFFDAFLQDIQNADAAPAPEPAPVYAPVPEPEPVSLEKPVYAPAPEPEPVYEAPQEPEPVYEAPVYEAPAYEEPAPAYEAPQATYDDDQVYGDEPPVEESVRGYETLEAEYEAADEAAPIAEEEEAWDPLGEPGLWDDGAEDAQPEAPAAEEAGTKKKRPKATKPAGGGPAVKQLAIAASSIAMLGAMSAGGWYLATDGGEKPIPGVDLAFVTNLFGPGEDSETTIAELKANAEIAREAVEACIKETGKLPKSQGHIQLFVSKNGKIGANPYHTDEEMVIIVGSEPVDPGVVAVQLLDDKYIIRVAGSDGKPLMMGGKEFQLTGGLGEAAVAAKPSASPEFPTTARTAAPTASADPGALPAAYPPAVPLVLVVAPPGPPTLAGTPAPPDVPTPEASIDLGNVTNNVNRIKRNRAFDFHRLRGIALIYESRTAEALIEFKMANDIKPDDLAVQAWLARVKEATAAAEAAEAENKAKGGGEGGTTGEPLDQDALIRQRMEEIGKRGAAAQAPAGGTGKEAPRIISEGGQIANPKGEDAGSMGDGVRPPLLRPPKL